MRRPGITPGLFVGLEDDMKLVDDEGKEIKIARLQALELRPEDVIVLGLPAFVAADEAASARNFFAQMFPGRKVVGLMEGVKLSAARGQEGRDLVAEVERNGA
jgi:hypothetical protein